MKYLGYERVCLEQQRQWLSNTAWKFNKLEDLENVDDNGLTSGSQYDGFDHIYGDLEDIQWKL